MKRIAVFILLCLIVSQGWGSYGQSSENYSQKIEKNKSCLENAKKKIQDKKTAQKRILAQEKKITIELQKIDRKLSRIQKKLSDWKNHYNIVQKNISRIEARLKIVQKDNLALPAVTSFSHNNFLTRRKRKIFDVVPIICDSNIYDDILLFSAQKNTNLRSKGLEAKYLWSKQRAKSIAQLEKEWWREQSLLEWLSSRILKLQKGYENTYDRRCQKLANFQEQKETCQKEIDNLESLIDTLNAEIVQLEKEKKSKESEKRQTRLARISRTKRKGQLPWPVKGEITAWFGKSKREDLDTYYISNGIKIRTSPQQAVIAVDKGKIIYAGNFQGYGKMVIIDHKNGFYSIYGELGEIIGQAGKHLKKGEVLGRVSSEIKQAELYFEIRYKGKPENPLEWLVR